VRLPQEGGGAGEKEVLWARSAAWKGGGEIVVRPFRSVSGVLNNVFAGNSTTICG